MSSKHDVRQILKSGVPRGGLVRQLIGVQKGESSTVVVKTDTGDVKLVAVPMRWDGSQFVESPRQR
jgi:hypothetical protein